MPLRTGMRVEPALNLTSMIDVVFLLLIFFMVGAKFTAVEQKIDLQVPQVRDRGTLTPAPEKRSIHIARTGEVFLGDEPVTLDELVTRLKEARAEYADLGVLIRADAESRHQRFAEAVNACRLAGIRHLAVAVRPKPDSR